MIDEFEALIAAEDAAALADVERDLAFMAAAGPGDALATLKLIEKTFDGGEDPRLLAGIHALIRICSLQLKSARLDTIVCHDASPLNGDAAMSPPEK